jgi:hypothetical protein
MLMAWRKKRIIGLMTLLIAGTILGSLALFANSLTGEVDPNLMKAECPGGKEWDSPGSSCHDGIIFDYVLPQIPQMSAETQRRVDNKKRRKVR